VPVQGYVYDISSNTATPIPGSVSATVPSDNGIVPALGFGPGGIVPLVRERDGSVTTLAGFPGSAITSILQFNRNGASVGWASTNFIDWFSFYRSASGAYTRLEYPDPVNGQRWGTFLLGWNESGTMVGYVGDASGTQFAGVIRHPDGTWELWNVPGSTATMIFAITESGILAGGYQDATGWHGFLWWHGMLETIDYPGAENTQITGINNRGQLVGVTFPGSSPSRFDLQSGFVALPSGRP
jgi:hypothetical protein